METLVEAINLFRMKTRPKAAFQAWQYLPGELFPPMAQLATLADDDQRPFISTKLGIVRLNPGDWVMDQGGLKGFVPVGNGSFVELFEPVPAE